MASIDIFYKTYKKDFKLLEWSLRSIALNVTGYNKVIVLIPAKEKQDYIDFFKASQLPANMTTHCVDEYGNGYLYQQACKMSAHKYTDADFILFADSDCIFDHIVDLQDYIATGKPELLYTPYDQVGDAICWNKPTEDFIGMPVNYEYMRRNCLIYHTFSIRAIYESEPNLESYIMSSERFSEFNAIGAYIAIDHPQMYNMINTAEVSELSPPIGTQLWSWADVNNNDPLHKAEYQRSLETINRVFNLNLTQL